MYGGTGANWTPHEGAIRTATRRFAFTLIELLVVVTIIGLLAALALGGMYRANISAKQLNTKTTVNQVAVQLNEIWESYRTRRLPIDPKLVLQSQAAAPYQYQYPNAVGWLQYFAQIRTAAGIPSATTFYPDLLSPFGNGVNPNNALQIAAIRLAAMRELMRLELPCRFSDFTSSTSGSPASANPIQTLLIPQPMINPTTPLANPGGLSEQYRQFFMSHANSFNTQYESAECLYMIIKFASQNELGQKSITDDPRFVGDVDGDGMPEIQDAFAAALYSPPPGATPYTQHNMPIAFIRWPTGFLSELQPGPTAAQYQNASTTTSEYAGTRHDIFDPLRIDPRAFTTTPLVFSAGPDGIYDVWEHTILPTAAAYNDPYFTDNTPSAPAPIFPITPNPQNPNPGLQAPLAGAVMDLGTSWPNGSIGSGGYADNITSHQLTTTLK